MIIDHMVMMIIMIFGIIFTLLHFDVYLGSTFSVILVLVKLNLVVSVHLLFISPYSIFPLPIFWIYILFSFISVCLWKLSLYLAFQVSRLKTKNPVSPSWTYKDLRTLTSYPSASCTIIVQHFVLFFLGGVFFLNI